MSPSHIGLLLLGVFQASVNKSYMPKSYTFDNQKQHWSSKSSNAKNSLDLPDILEIGTVVHLYVLTVHYAGGGHNAYVEASLMDK